MGALAACTPPPDNSEPVADSPAGNTIAERSAYSEVPLPPEADRYGTNPEQIALQAFGAAEPAEGNFSQEVELLEETPDGAVVILTQSGLLDDSVEGMRYRLEFESGENQWELVWAGRQVRCWPDRGSQEWSTELCS